MAKDNLKNNYRNYTDSLIFKMQHPVLYTLKQLGWSTVICAGIAGIAGIALCIFHFIVGFEWGDSVLACIGIAMALFAIWLPCWAFTIKDKGKWAIRILSLVITAMIIAVFVGYFAYIRPTYGA